jgi:2-C-methyl-D-erythritol 4-phosphate cytidylyltransferase
MNTAIILAGGRGTRMGANVDKLMLKARGTPLLGHTLIAFQNCNEVHEIILVARKDRQETYQKLCDQFHIRKLSCITEGGIERQDSVWNGLQQVSAACQWVLIHDGARSLITPTTLTRCIEAARMTGAAVPATRVKDTIKMAKPSDEGSNAWIEKTVDRTRLWIAQTPQVFRKELIFRAYEPLIRSRTIVTDCASAVERLGEKVSLVDCDPLNLKITTPEDLILAESIIAARKAASSS